MEAFTLRGLSFTYPQREQKALEGIDLTLQQGELMVLCGPSGGGKTTLLRQLKSVLAPHGTREGDILFEGRPLDTLSQREQAARIGFVQQSPENQLVTDKVWHELAFGLESLGYDTPTIRRRVAEMASFFGIQGWFYKNVSELSGGQKQLLNLAAVMAFQPSVLLLDEPTSQLDPIAAADFLSVLSKLNRELGVTVLLSEHRLEEALPLASSVAVLDGGRLLCAGSPGEVGQTLRALGHPMVSAMPTPMRVWGGVESAAPCPVTVREGREWLSGFAAAHSLGPLPPAEFPGRRPAVLRAEEVWFRYERELPDVERGLTLDLAQGELLALLGGNGTGKTTALRLLAGLLRPYRGTVRAQGKVVLLPQEPQTLFVKKTVREDLLDALAEQTLAPDDKQARMARVVGLCRLGALLDRHPYDLSGGERQRAALAKVLLLEPDILLLDEPTRGLDGGFKEELGLLLRRLAAQGMSILMVSHDIEFCAHFAHRCALFFDGAVVTGGPPRDFFSGNSFYTTAANRMARELLPQAVTAEDVIAACGGQLPVPPPGPPEDAPPLPSPEDTPDRRPKKLPWWRKLGAVLSGAAALALLLDLLQVFDLKKLLRAAGLPRLGTTQAPEYLIFTAALFLFALCVTRRPRPDRSLLHSPRKRLARRTLLATALVLLLIPLTLFAGIYWLEVKNYYFTALLVLLEAMLPFFLVFEGRRPQARELVLVAVLCALGVAGRAAFFMLPQFKPILALTVIAGVAFGGETGFLVGAVTMLASNVMFSQGPWTPWQMFAMGIIGFLAGILFRIGVLRRSRLSLCIFGALAAIFLYGGIMNPASALVWTRDLSWPVLLSYYAVGLPMDCVHAAATWFFLWVAAEPMLEKLDRVKVKYGLVER